MRIYVAIVRLPGVDNSPSVEEQAERRTCISEEALEVN